MKLLIGIIVIILTIIICNSAMNISPIVLWQPSEIALILGLSLGSFIIGNTKYVLKGLLKYTTYIFKDKNYNKNDYKELLIFLFTIMKFIKKNGLLAIESDLDKPYESALFTQHPKILLEKDVITFFCDYMRLISMGVDNHYQIEDLITQEKEIQSNYEQSIVSALSNLGDGMPALGIVAAVLGIIKSMGHISSSPEVLGSLIAGALVGTFIGILIAYSLILPASSYIDKYTQAKNDFLEPIRVAIVSYLNNNSPNIIVEFSRRMIPDKLKPTFEEMEKIFNHSES